MDADAPTDPADPLNRSRELVGHDLKSADGIAAIKALVRRADVLVEGFRAGVMERLGIGPDVLLAERPSLVYARMAGGGSGR